VAQDELDKLKQALDATDDGGVQKEAAARNLNTDGAPDKAAIIKLILADEEEKLAKARFQKMQEEEAAMAAREAAPDAVAQTIGRFDREFCAALPDAARLGDFAPADDDERFAAPVGVPDGKYRRTGSDWVFEFRRRRLVNAVRPPDLSESRSADRGR
jgi:hypothetical protein